jgi:hypothetical protein
MNFPVLGEYNEESFNYLILFVYYFNMHFVALVNGINDLMHE